MRILLVRILSLAALGLTALAACDGQSVDDAQRAIDQASQSAVGTGSKPIANGDPQCDLIAALPQRNGNLAGWLQSAHIDKGEGFQLPDAAALGQFQSAFESLLRDGATAQTVSAFDALGFELGGYVDDSQAFYFVLEEKAPRTGGGTYVVNPSASRELWLEVPHADSDQGTLKQGAEQLVALGARALLITGSNRCASDEASPCDGKTAKCGGKLRRSDVAHAEDNFFMSAHRALRAVHPNGIAVNQHGMESTGKEAAVLSDGTKNANPSSVANGVRNALNARLGGGAKAFSCNDPSDTGYRDLCGTSNVQGRFDNGSSNACTVAPTSSTGKFLHLEQDANLRGGGGKALVDALAEVIPCTGGGQGGQGCGTGVPVCR